MWRQLLRDEKGSTAVEYGLILVILSVIAIVSLIVMGNATNEFFTSASTSFR